MKERVKYALLGGLIGLILALLKIYFKGAGTYQVDVLDDAIASLIFLPLTSFFLFLYVSGLKTKPTRMRLFSIYLLSILGITLNHNMSHILFGSKPASFLMGIVPGFILNTILFGVIVALLSSIFWLLNRYIIKSPSFIISLKATFVYLFFCGSFFSDWGENLNMGGPDGNWYIYGNYSLILGIITVFIITLLIWRNKK